MFLEKTTTWAWLPRLVSSSISFSISTAGNTVEAAQTALWEGTASFPSGPDSEEISGFIFIYLLDI